MYNLNYSRQLILLTGLMVMQDEVPIDTIRFFAKINHLFSSGDRVNAKMIESDIGVSRALRMKHIKRLVSYKYLNKVPPGIHYELNLDKVVELNLLLK